MSTQTSAPPGAQWFALHTLSGQEPKVKAYIEKFKAAEELDDYVLEVMLPTETVSEVKGGKPWYFVKEAAGVIGFVGGDHPAALRQTEIDEIKNRIEAATGKEVPKVQYEIGEEVKITDGPFMNLNGRIDEIDPTRGKLKISVSIFGRFTPVELEYWQVQRTTD
jgi:transcriptional antiterminator NusG